jgi:hypothetical protein
MIRVYKQEQVQNVIRNIILRDVGMSYTTTTCITMKMMELFSYANIQKLPDHLFLSAWKKSIKLVVHDQSQFGQKFL